MSATEKDMALEPVTEKPGATCESSELELAIPTQQQVGILQGTSSAELAVAKGIRNDKKEQFFTLARENKTAPTSSAVKIYWGVAAVSSILLVSFVIYTLLRTQSSDANLEDRILSGDKTESLKALKEQSIQNYFTIFMLIIGVLLVGMFVAFGHFQYSKETTQYEKEKSLDVMHSARQTFDVSEDAISKLTGDLQMNKLVVATLEFEVDKCTKEIDGLSEKDEKNMEKIAELKEQKAEKEAKLAAAQATLKVTEKSLEEAKGSIQDLNQNLQGKEEMNKKLHEEAARDRSKISRLRDDLSRSECDTSSLRSRARLLEDSREEYRSRMHQLEVDNARLAGKKKPWFSISF